MLTPKRRNKKKIATDIGHIHTWEVSSRWGVILGVSKCKICRVVATVANAIVRKEDSHADP